MYTVYLFLMWVDKFRFQFPIEIVQTEYKTPVENLSKAEYKSYTFIFIFYSFSVGVYSCGSFWWLSMAVPLIPTVRPITHVYVPEAS